MKKLGRVRNFYMFKLLPLIGFIFCSANLALLLIERDSSGGGFYVPLLVNACFAVFFIYLLFHYGN